MGSNDLVLYMYMRCVQVADQFSYAFFTKLVDAHSMSVAPTVYTYPKPLPHVNTESSRGKKYNRYGDGWGQALI